MFGAWQLEAGMQLAGGQESMWTCGRLLKPWCVREAWLRAPNVALPIEMLSLFIWAFFEVVNLVVVVSHLFARMGAPS